VSAEATKIPLTAAEASGSGNSGRGNGNGNDNGSINNFNGGGWQESTIKLQQHR
jgi:hypothetical protein